MLLPFPFLKTKDQEQKVLINLSPLYAPFFPLSSYNKFFFFSVKKKKESTSLFGIYYRKKGERKEHAEGKDQSEKWCADILCALFSISPVLRVQNLTERANNSSLLQRIHFFLRIINGVKLFIHIKILKLLL